MQPPVASFVACPRPRSAPGLFPGFLFWEGWRQPSPESCLLEGKTERGSLPFPPALCFRLNCCSSSFTFDAISRCRVISSPLKAAPNFYFYLCSFLFTPRDAADSWILLLSSVLRGILPNIFEVRWILVSVSAELILESHKQS